MAVLVLLANVAGMVRWAMFRSTPQPEALIKVRDKSPDTFEAVRMFFIVVGTFMSNWRAARGQDCPFENLVGFVGLSFACVPRCMKTKQQLYSPKTCVWRDTARTMSHDSEDMTVAKHAKSSKAGYAACKDLPTKHKLSELFASLGAAYARWADSHSECMGVGAQRMRVLVLLSENGAMMMSKLRDELGVTATNITALVDVLERDKLVSRKAHPTDRRATLIELHPDSAKRFSNACGEFRDNTSELFSVFSKSEQETFLKFLLRMREALVERKVLDKKPSARR